MPSADLHWDASEHNSIAPHPSASAVQAIAGRERSDAASSGAAPPLTSASWRSRYGVPLDPQTRGRALHESGPLPRASACTRTPRLAQQSRHRWRGAASDVGPPPCVAALSPDLTCPSSLPEQGAKHLQLLTQGAPWHYQQQQLLWPRPPPVAAYNEAAAVLRSEGAGGGCPAVSERRW
eukprot:CAMPEP_0170594020 /NCGR_PEP_ID=MMETSP0224-20130122/13771_1 /TAXON_ID=285029 /ORGANISM="Togula jolla, Strain CCCM 725" /LENGTH=178 /DNA_ID=CAMNT_0010918037 /DNA_START=271 /DNA_END=809 /DNA_ORIENTATION=-